MTRQTARLNDTDPAPHVTQYAYDALGQLSGVDAPEVSYQYTYDSAQRLASVSGSAAETYRYDHLGRRIETASGGTPKRLVYAGQDLWSEYGADWNAAPARYAYAGLDRPLLRTATSGNTYYHADALGSIVATSNAAGQITASARYDAFGQTLAQTGTLPRYGYAGRVITGESVPRLWAVAGIIPGVSELRKAANAVDGVVDVARGADNALQALPAAKLADHHVFPQQYRKFFEQRGINIDEHTITMGQTNHLKGVHGNGLGDMPGGWNSRWAEFVDTNPSANAKDVYQFGGRLMDEYGLSGSTIHPYRK